MIIKNDLLNDLSKFYQDWLTLHKLPQKDASELLADFDFGEFDNTHKDTSYYTGWIKGFITMWDSTENSDFLESPY